MMQRRLQESHAADVHVRHVTAEKEMAKLTKRTLWQSKATEKDRGEHRARHRLQKNHVPPTHSCGDEKSSMKRGRKQFLWCCS